MKREVLFALFFWKVAAMENPEVRFVVRATELRTLRNGSYELVLELTPYRFKAQQQNRTGKDTTLSVVPREGEVDRES